MSASAHIGNQLALMLFKADDEEANSISTELEADEFLQREFPNLYPLIPHSEVKAFAERPNGKLPTFQYAWPQLHYSNNVVLAGDAIHTVKPYFGLGVNSALEDVRWLSQCLEKHPVRCPYQKRLDLENWSRLDIFQRILKLPLPAPAICCSFTLGSQAA